MFWYIFFFLPHWYCYHIGTTDLFHPCSQRKRDSRLIGTGCNSSFLCGNPEILFRCFQFKLALISGPVYVTESLRQESKSQTFCIYHAVYFTSFYMSLNNFTTLFFVSKVLHLARAHKSSFSVTQELLSSWRTGQHGQKSWRTCWKYCIL